MAITAAPVTTPQLRECPGCGLIPAYSGAGRRSSRRMSTLRNALRRTRRADGAQPGAHVRPLVLFVVLWLAMLMRVSSPGIVHEFDRWNRSIELINRGLWPLGIARRLHHGDCPAQQVSGMAYVLVGLQMADPPPASAAPFCSHAK